MVQMRARFNTGLATRMQGRLSDSPAAWMSGVGQLAFSYRPRPHGAEGAAGEVRKVGEAFAAGGLTEEQIGSFVTTLRGELQAGVHFRHDVTLAALAVALANQSGSFVDDFLQELAERRVSEIRLAPRVAREVLQRRQMRLESTAPEPAALSSPRS
jgi:hypothetical protein